MRTKNFKHDKVSGPVKSFFEGTAGVFFVFALICLFGGGAEGVGHGSYQPDFLRDFLPDPFQGPVHPAVKGQVREQSRT